MAQDYYELLGYWARLLAEAGLITKAKQGRWVMCSVVTSRITTLREALGP